MKHVPVLLIAVSAAALSGCASDTPPVAPVHYPVTYSVPVSPPQPAAPGTAPGLAVGATQDVAVEPGKRLFYQVSSPVPVTVFYYEKVGANPNGNLLGQMQIPGGAPISASIVPPTSSLEFVFDAAQPRATGVLQFTVSDSPLSETAGRTSDAPSTFLGH